MLSKWMRVLAFVGGLSVLASVATAQCPTPDRLDGGPCCTAVTPQLPKLQSFKQGAFGICWKDCDVEAVGACRAEWSNIFVPIFPGVPAPTPCDPRFQRLRLRDASGSVKWKGRIQFTYSRTWVETDAAGIDYQVWRYLLNGDLRPTTAAGLPPCPVPSCIGAFNKARFTGYMDYAQQCAPGGAGPFQYAWMLTHACDAIDHAPGFSRAGFFHPDRSFTFVGPSAGFAISPIQPIAAGGTAFEAVRRLRLPPAGSTYGTVCEPEEQIDAALDPIQQLCVCGLPTGPFQHTISDLGLASVCGTSIATPGGPFLPGHLSMGIGSWIDPTVYPGVEALRWNSGGHDYFDPCTGATRQEVFFGVTTFGGWSARSLNSFGVGFPLLPTFMDQGNSLTAAGATKMNTRYVSDHIINLNFP